MLYKTLSLWLFFSLSTIAIAQNSFQIKGSVISQNTLQPIEGATINGENLHAISSASGTFTIPNVTEGIYSFTISHLGYASKTITIKASSNSKNLKIL